MSLELFLEGVKTVLLSYLLARSSKDEGQQQQMHGHQELARFL